MIACVQIMGRKVSHAWIVHHLAWHVVRDWVGPCSWSCYLHFVVRLEARWHSRLVLHVLRAQIITSIQIAKTWWEFTERSHGRLLGLLKKEIGACVKAKLTRHFCLLPESHVIPAHVSPRLGSRARAVMHALATTRLMLAASSLLIPQWLRWLFLSTAFSFGLLLLWLYINSGLKLLLSLCGAKNTFCWALRAVPRLSFLWWSCPFGLASRLLGPSLRCWSWHWSLIWCQIHRLLLYFWRWGFLILQ